MARVLEAVGAWPAFDSLRDRSFRWFWLGRLASSATMEMGTVAQGWLAYALTGSALALGWVTAASSIARLVLSLFGGTIADRFERRRVLLWTRAAMMVNAMGLAVLASTGVVQVWHLVLYSFLGGIIGSLMMPAQQAYLSDLVGRHRLMNAVSLTSVGMGLMGIFGASLAGVAIDALGVQAVYFCIVGLYAVAMFSLIQLPDSPHQTVPDRNVWAGIRSGFSYLSVAPALVPLLGISVVRVVLGWTYRSMMPVYADEVLHFDARGLGLLSAAPGVGSLISSMILASLGRYDGKGRLLLLSGLAMGAGMLVYANTTNLLLVFLFLGFVGAARNAMMVTNQTLVQVNASDEYRGRVMAMYMMIMGLMPLGTIPAGALADAFGVPFVLTLVGALLVGIFGWLWLSRSRVRTML